MNKSIKMFWVTIGIISTVPSGQVTGQPIVASQQHPQHAIVTNLKNGDTLSSETELKIRVPDRGQEGEALTTIVDGKRDSFTPYHAAKTSQGFLASVILNTNAYSNGWHYLIVRLINQDQSRYHIKFENNISRVHLDTVVSPTSHITARNEAGKIWTVSITATDGSGSIIRSFRGYGKTINVHWDGKNAQGKSVPDDSYVVTIAAGEAKSHLEVVNKVSSI